MTECKDSAERKGEQTVTILLADDHEMMRQGLKKMVSLQDDLAIIAEASNGEEAVELAINTLPDIIIMDINMPKMDGIEATQQIISKNLGSRIIGLSLHDHESAKKSMLSAGATAYLSKNEAFDSLCHIIRKEAKRNL